MLAVFISAVSAEMAWNITEGLKEAFDKFTPRKPEENQESTHDEEVTKLADPNSKSEERHLSQGDLVAKGSEAEQGFESPDSRMVTVNEGIDRVSSPEVFERPLWSFQTTSHELEKVFDDLTERNLVETKASEEPYLSTSEIAQEQCLGVPDHVELCEFIDVPVIEVKHTTQDIDTIVKNGGVKVQQCESDIQVQFETPKDAYVLKECLFDLVGTNACMVDLVGVEVFLHDYKTVALGHNPKKLILQDFSSGYVDLMNPIMFLGYASGLHCDTIVFYQDLDNPGHFLETTYHWISMFLRPIWVHDPGIGQWSLVYCLVTIWFARLHNANNMAMCGNELQLISTLFLKLYHCLIHVHLLQIGDVFILVGGDDITCYGVHVMPYYSGVWGDIIVCNLMICSLDSPLDDLLASTQDDLLCSPAVAIRSSPWSFCMATDIGYHSYASVYIDGKVMTMHGDNSSNSVVEHEITESYQDFLCPIGSNALEPSNEFANEGELLLSCLPSHTSWRKHSL